MSLFENTLRNITAKGKRLSVALGDDAARLDNTVEDGPLDGTRPISDEAWDLAQDMVTDCYQLISILTPRRMQALKFAFSASLETAIGIAAHFKIADHIEELGGTASVKGLAEVCGTDATKLSNVLQTLTARHMFVERTSNVYSNNRHSRTLLRGGAAEMIEFYALVSGKAFDGFLPLMIDKNDMHSIDPKHGAFSRAYSVPLSISDWIMLPDNHVHLTQLVRGMPWLSETASQGVIDGFDWLQWGSTARVCDMGCSDGGIMSLLKSKHPTLRITCQDLAPVLPVARQTFEAAHTEALKHNEVDFIEQDYFQPQKTEADIYWLRGVLHDYTDDECVQILKHVAPQLERNRNARILINEIVKPSLLVPAEKEDHPASEGVPKMQSAMLEMSSLMQLHTTAFLAGKERSYDDFKKVFDEAGYRIVHFNRLHLYSCIVEIALHSK